MQDVVIVAATRTAIGSFQGALANIPPRTGRRGNPRLLEQTGLDPVEVDEVILGQVLTAGADRTRPVRRRSRRACPMQCRP
jgi:acetyl-CoA C-acetyltransferase